MAISTRRTSGRPPSRQGRDPFDELEALHDRFGQLLQFGTPGDHAPAAWVPAIDVEETDDAWIVEAELPGVRKDDVHVEVRDDELAIFGEIVEKERKGILRRKTRRVGEFDLHVTLPGGVDPGRIDASLDSGVLSVRIPKPRRPRPRRIEVGQR
jgi:HSP20 family protein